MPHAGQILPLAARRGAAALMGAFIALGCTGTGDVVVVIDSTMAADSVEVVAVPAGGRNVSSPPRSPAAPGDSIARLRALDDSASMLAKRFGELRGALSDEVAAMEAMDRRTPEYATRYDATIARTKDAERLRAERDSVRDRANGLRARLGIRAERVATASDSATFAVNTNRRASERRPVRGASLTLSLAPGTWLIGVARPGFDPARFDSVTVRKGAVDTLDFRGRTMEQRPGGR